MGALFPGRPGGGRAAVAPGGSIAGINVRILPVLFWMVCIAVGAAELPDVQRLAQDFPAGSITSDALAERALAQAQALEAELQAAYDLQRKACEDVFFANHCLGVARKELRRGEHEVGRVTLEAHDLRRRLQARANAASRAEQERRQAAEDALRPGRELEALRASQVRAQNAVARELDAQRTAQSAAQAEADSQARVRAQEAADARAQAERPALEVKASETFRKKQAEAASYEQTRERDRVANAKRRAERQAAREAQDAASNPKAPTPAP